MLGNNLIHGYFPFSAHTCLLATSELSGNQLFSAFEPEAWAGESPGLGAGGPSPGLGLVVTLFHLFSPPSDPMAGRWIRAGPTPCLVHWGFLQAMAPCCLQQTCTGPHSFPFQPLRGPGPCAVTGFSVWRGWLLASASFWPCIVILGRMLGMSRIGIMGP